MMVRKLIIYGKLIRLVVTPAGFFMAKLWLDHRIEWR